MRTECNRGVSPSSGTPLVGLQVRRASLVALFTLGVLFSANIPAGEAKQKAKPEADQPTAEDFMVVDCLLPGKVRRLGRRSNYITPRRPIRTTALECQIRGGEYTEFDRASYATALKVWLGEAKAGSAEAQYYVGQIYEKGLGLDPDYAAAAQWYSKAAEQEYSAAQISLGYLYEMGLGVGRDSATALNWYRKASGLPEEMIVLEGSEYQELLDMKSELAGTTEEIEKLQRQIGELERQLQEAEQGGERERQLQDQVQRLRKELEVGQLAVSQYMLRIADLEGEVAEAAASEPTGAVAQAPPPLPKSLDFGPYQALVIGNRGYLELEPLNRAIEDAEAIAAILEDKYDFRVRRLFDATRYDVLSALNQLREELTEKHNLLIYYVGHSVQDRDTQRSWWQPVDAEPHSRANWISTRVMNDHLDLIPAKHILVVADAAYSGILTRSSLPRLPQGMSPERRLEYIERTLEKRARLVMASGEGPSVFSDALIETLADNNQIVEASSVHRELIERLSAAQAPVVPEFAPIRWARSEGGGDFFFVPKRRPLASGP